MDTYNKFLAESVLTEEKVITYRLLSRALQVHVNIAKQMLYEFHKSQNAKRPGSVHATYLVYGAKKPGNEQPTARDSADGDIDMTSSPPEFESSSDIIPTFSLSLVPEERLDEALSEYDEVSSIHVYSVGPHPTKDLALIIDAANQVLSLQAGEDQKKLAVITNSRARRRERQGAGLKVAAAATTTAKAQVKPALAKPAPAPAPVAANIKEDSKPAQPGPTTAEKASAAPTLGKKSAAPLKRGASSGIMQAFSKATPKVKKEADTPETTTPSGENPNMQPLSDDGEDDEEMPQPQPKANAASDLKSRKQREEELRRMMEEDDEEEEPPEKAEDESAEEPMEEEPPAPEPAKEETPEIVTASTNGRRRGKRRVMRKKQIMDDQGYLVTIQEPGWESFSEDEPPPPTKPKTMSSAPPAQTAKPKKSGPKGSQGSIMSFFSKK
ncbi:hypothetical protein N656DRAFT_714991 [Canariomyces notabilis]|uniref:DNA polymerase delta subunit 3 n=1 Tax=Canariomyces notabilis TaxID=2074819 RepID=A0AAN6TA42_9PEZI|nr:hypothetical protein N656DRAFT_714991 [Canariomyces arenarius]